MALDGVGGQCHALSALLPGKTPGTYCTGSWVDPRAGLDGCGEEKISRHHRVRTPNHPVCSKSLYRLCYLGPYIRLLNGQPMTYRGADKSLARPGRTEANVSVRMAWVSFSALPCREKNFMPACVSILLKSRTSLTCFWACFLPGRAKDLSAPRYLCRNWGGGRGITTRWFKYDRDWLHLVYTQIVPVIFEPPCICKLALKGDGLSAPCCVHFTPGKTYSVGGWMGLGANLDCTENLSPTGIQLLDCPAHSDSLYWLCCPNILSYCGSIM